MKYILIAFLFASCTNLHRSEMKTEKGKVVGKQFTPDSRQTVMSTGISSDGKLIYTTHSIGDKEKYTVIFRCEHGVIFPVNDAAVFAGVADQDSVYIDYYELLNSDTVVKDLEFVDARRITK